MLVLRRHDPVRNMARFYCLSLERSLFGETILVLRWGRVGTYGQRREHHFGDAKDAASALTRKALAKTKRGYLSLGVAVA